MLRTPNMSVKSFRAFLQQEAVAPIRPTDRIVYSTRPTLDTTFRQSPVPSGDQITTADIKPQGMWYGLGTSWKDYASENGLRVGSYVYRVQLDPDRILAVTPVNLRSFTRQYGERWRVRGFDLGWKINWNNVAQHYAGVEFNPYNKWSHKVGEDSLWYQGIDVPSGCVWDGSAITSVESLSS